jgi:branched-chain amino acid transport system permease protein
LGFVALSVGFLVSQAGMISLAQLIFYGATGYVVGLMGSEGGFPFPIPDVVGIGVVILLAVVVGLISARTRGVPFLMLTLAFGQLAWAFTRQNTSVLHGWAGFQGIAAPVLFGLPVGQFPWFYWASLVTFAVFVLLTLRLVRSPFGLILNGTRDSPRRMAALGYRVYYVRVAAFVFAGVLAGMGGLVGVYADGIITPTALQLSEVVLVLLMVIVGGANMFWGPIIGAFLVVFLQSSLSSVTDRYMAVLGALFAAVVLILPGGLLSLRDHLDLRVYRRVSRQLIDQRLRLGHRGK